MTQTNRDEMKVAKPKDSIKKENRQKEDIVLTQHAIGDKKSKCPDCHRDYQRKLICSVCGKCINCCQDR